MALAGWLDWRNLGAGKLRGQSFRGGLHSLERRYLSRACAARRPNERPDEGKKAASA
jgi:hypothetical protein